MGFIYNNNKKRDKVLLFCNKYWATGNSPAVMSSEHCESRILSHRDSAEKPANWKHQWSKSQTFTSVSNSVILIVLDILDISNSPLWSEQLRCGRRPTWLPPAPPPSACRWTRGRPSSLLQNGQTDIWGILLWNSHVMLLHTSTKLHLEANTVFFTPLHLSDSFSYFADSNY